MRSLDVLHTVLALTFLGVSATAQRPVDPTVAVPRLDASLGFQYIDANAPPGGCKCFGLAGGYVSAGLHLNQWLTAQAEVTGTHASNISLLGQDLTLITYMAGPRVSLHRRRLVPFGQALFGAAHGSDSYFPTGATFSSSASSFAISGGGGVDYNLTPRFAIRAIEAQYLRTSFPNGTTNTQNHLMIGAGIVVKFRGRDSSHAVAPPEVPNKVTTLACTTKDATLMQGQVLEVVGKASTMFPRGEPVYSWTSSAGSIQGSGRRVTVNTAGVAPGDYVVAGHASLAENPEGADCEVSFHVTARPEPPVVIAAPPPVASAAHDEQVFHENVPDALFDYDKWNIRPDAQAAINHAAEYLILHPNLRVLIGGYSDERGTAEYNIALGLKRANATRDALIAAGVPPDRMQIISYGKGAQVCTSENESCWQQNRRAAFSIHP